MGSESIHLQLTDLHRRLQYRISYVGSARRRPPERSRRYNYSLTDFPRFARRDKFDSRRRTAYWNYFQYSDHYYRLYNPGVKWFAVVRPVRRTGMDGTDYVLLRDMQIQQSMVQPMPSINISALTKRQNGQSSLEVNIYFNLRSINNFMCLEI